MYDTLRASRGAGALRVGARGVRGARRHRALPRRRTPRVHAHSRRDAHEPARTRHPQRTREPARPHRARARPAGRSTSSPTTSSPGSRRSTQARSRISRSCAGSTPALRRQLGRAIFEAVARGEALPDDELPERPKRPLGQQRDTLVALMGVVVGEIARENGSAAEPARAPRSALERVAREVPATARASKRALGLSPWRIGARRRAAVATSVAASARSNRRLRATATPKYACPMNPHANSFNALDTLARRRPLLPYFRLDALERAGLDQARAPAVLAQDSARESAALRRRPLGHERRHRSARALESARRPARTRDRVPPGARAAARFHRRAVRRRPRGDARRDGRRWAAIPRRSIRCSRSNW